MKKRGVSGYKASIIVLALLLIWGNSFLPSGPSYRLSGFVSSLLTRYRLEGLVSWLSFLGKSQGSQVRKAAHLTEFGILGAAVSLLTAGLPREKSFKLLLLSFCGMFVSLMDETIQLFTQRTSSVRDIWIDLSGYCCGVLIALLLRGALRRWKKWRAGRAPAYSTGDSGKERV